MRTNSPVQMRNGGWLHKEDNPGVVKEQLMRPMPTPKASIDPAALMARWSASTTDADRDNYAQKLGVDFGAIEVLGAAYSASHKAWAWPMFDSEGTMCGIRLRSDSAKWAVTGSRQGIFVPNFMPARGTDAMICEGPTDTAAALTLGFYAIGRPACQGGVDLVRGTLARLGLRRAIIMSDNDEAKLKPDGSRWYPGQEGARALARDLKMPCIVIQPGAKDIRAWLRAGATRADVDFLIKQKFFK